MPFANIIKRDTESNFKKVVFTAVKEGRPVRVRILDNEAIMVYKHFIPGPKASVVCLGQEACPVCINNRKLIEASPGTKPNQIRGYYPRQTRYLVNVLNRTPAKFTSEGFPIFPTNNVYPANDPKTGESLTGVEPRSVNRVEVLERGVTLFSQLDTINSTLTDVEGNPLGIWNYDTIFSASGSGTDTVITVTPNVAINDKIDLEAMGLEKYDLSQVSMTLSPEDVEKLLRGVSLQDIFASHKVAETVDGDPVETDLTEDVDRTISELFPD